jgi:glycosyltransferase involved in cell wall biosynthesis
VVTMGFTGFGDFGRHPGRVARPLFNLFRLIRGFRPDVVHGFLFWAYVLGTLAARLAGVPIVVTSRRIMEDFKATKSRYLFLDRVANRLTDVIVANSEAVRQDTIAREHLAYQKVGMVYNGIEVDRYLVPSDETIRHSSGLVGREPLVGVIATLDPRKGHPFLLEAWATVAARYPSAIVLLIGDGPSRPELEAQAQSAGLGQSVRFLGTRHDIPDLLALLDLVVHPSLTEGFSNAILEAMAAGKPVVATAVGGNPEAVVDRVTGLLVPARDSQALAQAMLRLLEHPDEAAAFGCAGRERVAQRFGMQLMVREYELLYERLVSEKGIG